jgi:MFS family permease
MLGIVWANGVGGVQFTLFATMLGADDFHFGLLASAPYLAMIGQFIGAMLVERHGLTKHQFIHAGLVHRLLWLAVAAIPLLLPIPSTTAVWMLLITLMLSHLFSSIMMPAGLVWSGNLIPRRIRGRYYANRAILGRPAQIGTVIILGVVLNYFGYQWGPGALEPQPELVAAISIIFAISALFGAGDILLCSKVPQVLRSVPGRAPTPGLRATLRLWLWEPFGDRLFRHFALYSATLAFGIGLMGLFLWRNAIENLGFSPLTANVLFLVISPVLGLIGARAWGRGIDRWGARPILIVATIGVWLTSLPWLVASPGIPAPRWLVGSVNAAAEAIAGIMGVEHYVLLGPGAPVGAFLVATLACTAGGISWTGVSLAQNNVMLGFSDGAGRSRFIAASSVITSIGGGLGAICGGLVADRLGNLLDARGLQYIEAGVFRWNQWHVAFALSSLLRLASTLWLAGMPNTAAASTGQLVRQVSINFYNAVTSWVFSPLKVMGWRRSRRPRR